jgi:hypothetical protein
MKAYFAKCQERAGANDKALKEKICRRTAWLFNPEAH